MEKQPIKTKIDDQSFVAFLDQVQSRPSGFLSGGQDLSPTEGNVPAIPLRNENPEQSQLDDGENDFFESEFESEKEDNLLEFFLKSDTEPKEQQKESLSYEQDSPFMNSFLTELVNSMKNTLSSIYHATVLTMDKFDDADIKKRSHRQIKEDIRRMDSVLNSLLNFININTPIAKTDTLSVIFDEILEANEKQLREKNIKVMKRCEKNLPETYIHNEQIRFILHSILQYAVFSTSPNETIGLLMKSSDFHDGLDAKKPSSESKEGYVEVVVGFNGNRKLLNPLENSAGTSEDQGEEAIGLILRLVKEILQKNRGRIAVETNGKRPNTLVTLRFPIERRKVVYYAPITL